MEWIQGADNAVLGWIQQYLAGPAGDWLMPLITALGNAGAVWIISAAILLCMKKWRKTGVEMLVALAIAAVIGSLILKPLVGRERPFNDNDFAGLLITPPTDFSFPSGHTSSSVAAAVVLLRRDKRLGIPALALAVLIAFSRLYLYVHYPSDVLAGAALGVIAAFLAGWLVSKIPNPANRL